MPKDSKFPDADPRPGWLDHRHSLIVFSFLMLTQLIATLDNQIVSTAMPTIVGDFGQAEHFSWLISAYILAQCCVMPIYGKLGDLFGRKYVLIVALAIFTLGSLACAASWSMESLIAARFMQGLGTGGMLVSVFAVNADLFEPRRRARFQSYLSFVFVFGSFFGPALGGFLTDTLGWRSIFLVTAPLGCMGILGVFRFLPLRRTGRKPVIDHAGALTLAAIVLMIVIWVDSARLLGGFTSLPSLALAGAIALGGALWIRIERHAAEPILPLALLGQRTFAMLVLSTFCFGGVSIALVSYYAYYVQMALGLTPSQTGLIFIAITIGVSSGALIAGRLMAKGVHFVIPLRMALALCAAMLLALSLLPRDVPLAALFAVLILQGMSTGLAMNAIVLGAQVTSPDGDVGAATGAISLVRTIGGAVGIALFGSIIAAGIAGLRLPSGETLSSMTPATLQKLPADLHDVVAANYAVSFAALFRTAAAMAATGFVFALCIRRTRN